MRLPDVDLDAITHAIAEMPRAFRSKHVTDHVAVRAAHGQFVEDISYRQIVAKAMRRHVAELRIEYVGPGSGNAHWRRTDLGPEAATPRTSPGGAATQEAPDLGPQYPRDRPFTAA